MGGILVPIFVVLVKPFVSRKSEKCHFFEKKTYFETQKRLGTQISPKQCYKISLTPMVVNDGEDATMFCLQGLNVVNAPYFDQELMSGIYMYPKEYKLG